MIMPMDDLATLVCDSRMQDVKQMGQGASCGSLRVCLLWQQNEEVVTRMGKYTGITTACTATAETSSHLYTSRREKIVDQVVIGTPGTLKRWMTKDKALDTKNIKILVFDEADQMLDQVRTLPTLPLV